MIQLLQYAKGLLSQHVPQNGILVDFTMGNGYDTSYLCSLVPAGTVYAFDVQKQAVDKTRERLLQQGHTNAVLIHDSHAQIKAYIRQPIHGGMFNLGYLPGSDKRIHTMQDSTYAALTGGLSLLCPGCIIVVSVYPGHEEGAREGDMLLQFGRSLDKRLYCVLNLTLINAPDAPFIIAFEKYDKPENWEEMPRC